MLTVVIKDDGEPNVTKLTYENLWREVKDIQGSELLVAKDWFEALKGVKNTYVCLVEADCLVSSGYFASQVGIIKKNPMLRKLSMMSSAVGVNNFANRFYGYTLDDSWSEPSHEGIRTKNKSIIPNRDKKSTSPYPVQVGYIPGAVIRVGMLRKAISKTDPKIHSDNFVLLSAQLSVEFWKQGDGNPVYINPNTSYVTTEGYVNDINGVRSDEDVSELMSKFKNESI